MNERRSREYDIMLNVNELTSLPMDEFNDLIGRQGYCEEELKMCREIRKKEKNKLASQKSRKKNRMRSTNMLRAFKPPGRPET